MKLKIINRVSEDEKCVGSHPLQKTAQDTNFVTAWVVVAFLFFEFGSVIAMILHAILKLGHDAPGRGADGAIAVLWASVVGY